MISWNVVLILPEWIWCSGRNPGLENGEKSFPPSERLNRECGLRTLAFCFAPLRGNDIKCLLDLRAYHPRWQIVTVSHMKFHSSFWDTVALCHSCHGMTSLLWEGRNASKSLGLSSPPLSSTRSRSTDGYPMIDRLRNCARTCLQFPTLFPTFANLKFNCFCPIWCC